MAISGTPKRVTIDGITYNVAADANFTQNELTQIEGQATSGDTMYKVTKQIPTIDSVTLSCDGAQYELLKAALAKGSAGEVFPMSASYASGDVYRATGNINIEGRDSETNIATVMMIPEGNWSAFLV